ncbi:MAG: Nif3-like dinuclear metal center hexameric protein [Dorea sp.]|nr:Nif3-like dinuclear metal center hexameric protein [Dorea sp.]
MLCREVTDIIEQRFPKEYALDWDNVGLLAGRDDKEVRCIYIALDASDEVIHAAARQGADMLVTHHPLIFSGMKRITNQDFIGRRILGLIRRDISYYAMHTNYDVLGMAALSGSMIGLKQPEALEVTCEAQEGIGRIGQLEKAVSLKQCCEDVKRAFHLESVRVFGNPDRTVERIAICPGSGKSVIGEALKKQADVLITGDIGHHEGIDAAAQGMAVIDAGHYGLEHIFVEDMKDYLGKKLEGVQIITAPVCHPFVNI